MYVNTLVANKAERGVMVTVGSSLCRGFVFEPQCVQHSVGSPVQCGEAAKGGSGPIWVHFPVRDGAPTPLCEF